MISGLVHHSKKIQPTISISPSTSAVPILRPQVRGMIGKPSALPKLNVPSFTLAPKFTIALNTSVV